MFDGLWARIFVLGHYLILKAHRVSSATPEHICAPNGGYYVFIYFHILEKHVFYVPVVQIRESHYSGVLPSELGSGVNRISIEQRWRKSNWTRNVNFWGSSFRTRLTPGFHADYFFLALFFCLTHDGLKESGNTRSLFHPSLNSKRPFAAKPYLLFITQAC